MEVRKGPQDQNYREFRFLVSYIFPEKKLSLSWKRTTVFFTSKAFERQYFRSADSRKRLLRRDIITVAHPPRETIYASVDPEKPFPPFFPPSHPIPTNLLFLVAYV